MVDDLLYYGRVTSFRREQGFGVITLEDGRVVKFDASNCTMVPEEGARVQLRVGPARWGGGLKALHVEENGTPPPYAPPASASLEQQIAQLQREHLLSTLTEHAMEQLVARAFGGQLGKATLVDVLDAFYTADPAAARQDGYVRFAASATPAEAIAAIDAALPGIQWMTDLEGGDVDRAVFLANRSLGHANDRRGTLFRLRSSSEIRAYLTMMVDRAHRLSGTLPLIRWAWPGVDSAVRRVAAEPLSAICARAAGCCASTAPAGNRLAALRRQVLDETADDRLVRLVDLGVGQRAVRRAILDRPQHALAAIAQLGVAVVLEQPNPLDQRLDDLLDHLDDARGG